MQKRNRTQSKNNGTNQQCVVTQATRDRSKPALERQETEGYGRQCWAACGGPLHGVASPTMNALVANSVVALPVAAPPGQWIGAGGSMIMESDKQTGTIRKHYIGMVTMLNTLAHIARDNQVNGGGSGDRLSDLDQKMAVPVSNIMGHCLEGLSLWTLNPNTR